MTDDLVMYAIMAMDPEVDSPFQSGPDLLNPTWPVAEEGRGRCDVGSRRRTGRHAALALTTAFDP